MTTRHALLAIAALLAGPLVFLIGAGTVASHYHLDRLGCFLVGYFFSLAWVCVVGVLMGREVRP